MPRAVACGVLLGLGLAAAGRAAELTLSISNIPAGGGELMIQVLGSQAAFDGEAAPSASLILPAISPAIAFSTTAIEPGEYGVRVMHDRNGNRKLDSNLVGIPTEPWGFSNNASGSFGPPGWEAVRFELDGDLTQDIRLNQ
jgi:uncharacterized protein (DUF2141 family)